MRRSSRKGMGFKAAAVVAIAGFAAGMLMRKRPEQSDSESTGAQPIDREFSDIARGNDSQVPGVDPLPPREPM